MLAVNYDQHLQSAGQANPLVNFPLSVEARPESEIDRLLDQLSPDNPWGERQIAAKKLGYLRNVEAVPGLLAALPDDPFWMVRFAIIQALLMIGDPGAIPVLHEVAKKDGYQAVRSYAAKAVNKLARIR